MRMASRKQKYTASAMALGASLVKRAPVRRELLDNVFLFFFSFFFYVHPEFCADHHDTVSWGGDWRQASGDRSREAVLQHNNPYQCDAKFQFDLPTRLDTSPKSQTIKNAMLSPSALFAL